MKDIEQEILELKARLDSKASEYNYEKYEKDRALADLKELFAKLVFQFGVHSIEEAKQLLETMEKKLQGLIAEMSSKLGEL